MEIPFLQARKRDLSLKPASLRLMHRIPAVCYGHGQDNLHLEMDYQLFRKVHQVAGENMIIDLKVEGENQACKVLVHEVQYHPVYGDVIHVDFVYVRMDEEVTTRVPITLKGLAPAVKELAAVLVTHKHEITIRCLPQDLIHQIEVDISGLANFYDAIHVKDLQGISAKIKILEKTDDMVVSVVPPRAEEEEAPAAAPAAEVIPGAEGAETPKTPPAAEEQKQAPAK